MKDDSLAKLASFENAQLMGLVSIEVLPTSSIEQIDIDWILESRKKMSHEWLQIKSICWREPS